MQGKHECRGRGVRTCLPDTTVHTTSSRWTPCSSGFFTLFVPLFFKGGVEEGQKSSFTAEIVAILRRGASFPGRDAEERGGGPARGLRVGWDRHKST